MILHEKILYPQSIIMSLKITEYYGAQGKTSFVGY